MQDTDLTFIPSDLPSMMRWFQGDNVKASSLEASRVVKKLVAATTKAFPTVQGKRREELRLRRGESSCYAATVANATSRFSTQLQPPCPPPPRRRILLRNLHPDPLREKVREREKVTHSATNLYSNAVVVSLLTNPGNAALGVRGVNLKEAVPSADQGDDDNVEAAGGEGPDLVLLITQGVPTTSETSATQAQTPPPIIVVNIFGNVTKGE